MTPGEHTLMYREAAEAGAAVNRLLAANADVIATLADRLRRDPPPAVITCARGSSDHAATYGKYLIETMFGIPVASAAPSVASLYRGAPTRARNLLCIAISQSGRSPDLIASVKAQREGGGHIVALVNDTASPLADAADTVIALSAGVEHSVAATKSFITALAGLAALAAAWARDDVLSSAVSALPQQLGEAWERDWSALVPRLHDARNMFVIGRGLSLGIAQEMALKLKETCGLHAEAFSSAEVRHGPMAIIDQGFPILAIAGSDTVGKDVAAAAAEFAQRGAAVVLVDPGGCGLLPAAADHPAIEPILMIQSFYRAANALSLARGLNPDAPRHLQKITRTR